MDTNWKNTKSKYSEWLLKNKIKELLINESRYKGFSLWWATKLVDKDVINDGKWYYDLDLILRKKKIKKTKLNTSKLFLKFFKKIIKSILFNLLIKLLIPKKKITKKNKNYFYCSGLDLIEKFNFFIDKQYGKISLINTKEISYIINLNEDINFIKNITKFKDQIKKIPCDYFILDHYISIIEILKIYFFTIFQLLKLMMKINKKYFYIKNIDCSFPLKNHFIESFFENIQLSLISGISVGKLIEKEKCKNLISYLEFYPLARSIYHFSKFFKNDIKLISINHANYSKENLFFDLKKNEFNNKKIKFNTSSPDIFFCQGKKYFNYLKTIFPKKKIFLIGSLKLEMEDIKLKKKLNNSTYKKLKKKILLILPSLNDYKPFVELLNQVNLKNYEIILNPHPMAKKETIIFFKNKFIHNFSINKNLNVRSLINVSDRIIFGDSSIGLEAALKNKNVFRIYDQKYIPTFTPDNEIPTALNPNDVNNFLNQKKINQKSKLIKEMYFFKYDQNASKRFYKILNKL